MLLLQTIVLTVLFLWTGCQRGWSSWYFDDLDRGAWYRGGASTSLGRWIMGGRGRGGQRGQRARIQQSTPLLEGLSERLKMENQGVRRSYQAVQRSDEEVWSSDQDDRRSNQVVLSADVPTSVVRSRSEVGGSDQDLFTALQEASKGLWVRKLWNEDGTEDFVIIKDANRRK